MIRKLIEAVEAGEYHRKDGPPRFSALYEALGGPGNPHPEWVKIGSAMLHGPAATAAILRALDAKGPTDE